MLGVNTLVVFAVAASGGTSIMVVGLITMSWVERKWVGIPRYAPNPKLVHAFAGSARSPLSSNPEPVGADIAREDLATVSAAARTDPHVIPPQRGIAVTTPADRARARRIAVSGACGAALVLVCLGTQRFGKPIGRARASGARRPLTRPRSQRSRIPVKPHN